jgi:lysozyme family protein
VNDPDDPGGATNFGVTIHTMRRLGLDLDGDGDVDPDDVRRLTRLQARDIFVDHYFRRPGIARLPEVLQPSVFDMYVNAGSNAVRILQRLLAEFGHPATADGVIGPKTVAAAEAAFGAAPRHLADAYGIARRNYYYALADRRPASRKYARRRDGGKGGWILRAEEFIAPRYHLTPAQHRERTASWG